MIISYSQHNEDILLHALLNDIEEGFYVDVGANDPVADSVTKFFYDRKWHGVNIEPINSLYKKLQTSRPRDINLNIGVAQKKGKLRLREYGMGRHGLSSFVETSKAPDYLPYEEYDVTVKPLKSILKESGVKRIDFMKIDVEGMENEVIRSNDWSIFRPQVLLIEDNNTQEWYNFIIEQNYKEVCFDGLNRYFVTSESKKDLREYQKILNEEVVAYKTTLKNKEIDKLSIKLQDMYEKHTELGKKWNEINNHPQNFFTKQELKRALKQKYKDIIKNKLSS